MAIAPGDRLGPYEVVSPVGAGGMGVVYRARDTRLGRDVAIKLSAERFTERFEREARAVAALNHPNICTLHDVGPDYLVMEFVEGDTLAEVLAPRSAGLPLDEALRIARQIASALEAAHEKGIIHRDLKPGNIKVKADGTVKVLDFGLAKFDVDSSQRPASDAHALTNSPTLGATGIGMILGTAAYMAPEQARGKPVDKRADIWAFGVVFYEMLTGRRPFDGEDASSVLASVIQAEPKWDGVPHSMHRLMKKCLEKDPKRRLRDIGDAWDLIEEAAPSVPVNSKSGWLGWIAAGVVAMLAALALWAPWRSAAPMPDRPIVRLDVDLGSEIALIPLATPTLSSVAISSDGTRLVYVASVAGSPPKLVTRKLDEGTATVLVGTEGAASPFFSPDGQWIAFHSGQTLNKISVNGGGRVPLMESTVFAGGFWTDTGDLLIGSGLQEGLLRVPSSGGTASRIVDLAPGELFYAMPQLLPGGNDVLVTIYGTPPGPDRAAIDIVSLKDRSRKTVARGGTAARYLPTGHLVYTNRSTMFAVPFDLTAREVHGAAVPVLTDIAFDIAAGISQYSISADGTLVYRRNAAGASGTSNAVWLDTSGKQDLLPMKPAQFGTVPRLSPDGKRLAMAIREGANQDIWIYDIERAQMTRMTFGDETFSAPVWTPDGKFLVFGSIGNGLFWTRADGGGKPLPLVNRKSIAFPFSFSPGGARVAFYEVSGTPQIWTIPLQHGDDLKAGDPERYNTSQFVESSPMFSPDGNWMAYESNETGRQEVYVRAFPIPASGQGGKVSISNTGGSSPIWSPNGRELLYQSGNQVLAVDYKTDRGAFVAGKPRVWLTTLRGAQGFELAPDGKRVVVLVAETSREAPRDEHTIAFVQNFFDELRRRAPVVK